MQRTPLPGTPLARTPLLLAAAIVLGACRHAPPKTAAKPVPAAAPAPVSTRPASAPSVVPALPAQAPLPSLGQLMAGFGSDGGGSGPRPYVLVIGPQARTHAGLVKTHEVRGRLYFEIPARELGRDMLIVTSIRGTPSSLGLGGTLGGPNRLVRWERKDQRVLLRAMSYRNVSTDTSGAATRALDLIRYEPILAVFNIETFGPDSAAVIDVTRLFTGGIPELAGGGQRVNVDPTRSFIERVAAFDRSVEIEASQTFAAPPNPALASNPAALLAALNASATTELYHFSMVRLPDVPMTPRLADERVGFITTQQLDFGSPEQRVSARTFINRWRLECAAPDATVPNAAAPCTPKKPIVYYVDPATPAWLAPWIKRGIEEWRPAFAAAGFKDAIVARDAPPNDPALAGENATVSMVRWLPSTTENAVGPSTVDPRSGEILDADVQLYQNILNLERAWYFTQVGHLDPRARRFPLPDSLLGRLVESVVAHEVGHTLGLAHNMKASSLYPLDSVRSRTWVARMGFAPSIMDYARFDYVAQPEDHIALGDLVPRVGPYDTFAIRWGYAPVPNAVTAEQERPTLDRWARAQDTVPWLRFGGDVGIYGADPGEANEAVGDADAVRATALGLANLRRIAKLVEPATTATPGATYDDLEEIYGRLVDQWATELGHVARIPGGASKHDKVVGQPGDVYTPISATRQRAAVAFLNANAFTTPAFLLDPSILRKIEPAGSIERIGAAQRRVLATLLDNARLERMVEGEGLAAGSAYTLGEMLGDLRRGVWREMYAGAPIDPYRRRLQRSEIEVIGAKVNQAPNVVPAGVPRELAASLQSAPDAVALLRGELVDLDRDLAEAIPRTSDRTSRLHLQAAREQIGQILHPRR